MSHVVIVGAGLAGLAAAPVGRIHWAGAECSPQRNGYMEGAVRSGEAITEAIAEAVARL